MASNSNEKENKSVIDWTLYFELNHIMVQVLLTAAFYLSGIGTLYSLYYISRDINDTSRDINDISRDIKLLINENRKKPISNIQEIEMIEVKPQNEKKTEDTEHSPTIRK